MNRVLWCKMCSAVLCCAVLRCVVCYNVLGKWCKMLCYVVCCVFCVMLCYVILCVVSIGCVDYLTKPQH